MNRNRDDNMPIIFDVTCEALQAGKQDQTPIHSTQNDPTEPVTHHTPYECSCVLPVDFTPSKNTVIVGGGMQPKQNMGNKRLRELASTFLPQYSEATDKRTKSRIVSCIVHMVRNACPEGGAFVKYAKNGLWYEVNDTVAREKIGYSFRDLLSHRYRSSSKSKVARRHSEQQQSQASLTLTRAMITMTYSMEPIPASMESDMDTIDSDIEPLDIRQEEPDEDFDLEDLLSSPLFL
jgi:hypothetical protein